MTDKRLQWSRDSNSPSLHETQGDSDYRIRTGDPLFTNQAAIEFSCWFRLSMYSKDVH
jgi:hypothetical protein